MNIYFLRHGSTTASGTYTGSSDVELSEAGCNEIRSLATHLQNIDFDLCYCSPLTRCRTSFELLELDLTCIVDQRLREIDFGSWEGMSFDQIVAEDSQGMKSWASLKDAFQFPGGDSIKQFSLRVQSFVDELKSVTHENVLIVSHGGVIRYALTGLLGLGGDAAERFEITEAGLTLISFDHSFATLRFLNMRYS